MRGRPSDLVAIFGIGGLGHVATQYAKAAGAVAAVDLTDEKLLLARELGADYTINGRNEDPVDGGSNKCFAEQMPAHTRATTSAKPVIRRGGTHGQGQAEPALGSFCQGIHRVRAPTGTSFMRQSKY